MMVSIVKYHTIRTACSRCRFTEAVGCCPSALKLEGRLAEPGMTLGHRDKLWASDMGWEQGRQCVLLSCLNAAFSQ